MYSIVHRTGSTFCAFQNEVRPTLSRWCAWYVLQALVVLCLVGSTCPYVKGLHSPEHVCRFMRLEGCFVEAHPSCSGMLPLRSAACISSFRVNIYKSGCGCWRKRVSAREEDEKGGREDVAIAISEGR